MTANRIVGRLDRSRLVVGKDGELSRTGLAASKGAGAIDIAAETRQDWGADCKAVVDELAILVVNV